MKKLSILFGIITLLLSHLMCVTVAYNYSAMLCCIEHLFCSAPANIAFLYAIPFLICIIISTFLSIFFYRKAKK